MFSLVKVSSKVTLAVRLIVGLIYVIAIIFNVPILMKAFHGVDISVLLSQNPDVLISNIFLVFMSLFAPSPAGWSSVDKELPKGLTVGDVVTKDGKPVVGENNKVNNSINLPIIFLFVIIPLAFCGCACKNKKPAEIYFPQSGEVRKVE